MLTDWKIKIEKKRKKLNEQIDFPPAYEKFVEKKKNGLVYIV